MIKLIGNGTVALLLCSRVLLPDAFAVPPPNDICTGAEVIPTAGPFPYYSAIVDITDATTANDPPALPSSCTLNGVTRSVWYAFTPPATRLYTLSVSEDTATTVSDTVMAIYTSTGGCNGPFTRIACDDDVGYLQTAISLSLSSSTTYYIVVWESSTSNPFGGTAVQLRVSQPVVPTNDTCEGAEVIPAAGPFPHLTAVADTTLATTTSDPTAPTCQSQFTRSIWYRFTPDAAGAYEFSLCTNTATTVYDTLIGIYTSSGACVGPFTRVACNDNGATCGGNNADLNFRSVLTLSLTSGVGYYVVVWETGTDPYIPGETSIQLLVSQLRPQFTSHVRLPDGSFQLQFTGAPGQSYTIQASTNLTAWPDLGAATNLGNGLFAFTDTNANNFSARFYRVVLVGN
ncbi:MAG: hypothetical protein HY298_19510 [Verrucomicrobia bacterium]|nr:hypothetical protein [Verrucomicrobiota bacterium]